MCSASSLLTKTWNTISSTNPGIFIIGNGAFMFDFITVAKDICERIVYNSLSSSYSNVAWALFDAKKSQSFFICSLCLLNLFLFLLELSWTSHKISSTLNFLIPLLDYIIKSFVAQTNLLIFCQINKSSLFFASFLFCRLRML